MRDEGRKLLIHFRIALFLFIVGIVLSGVTAFPLLSELRLLDQLVANFDGAGWLGLQTWIHKIHLGLESIYQPYPWIGYGTDWLAFGHIIIALFFIGPWLQPVQNRWVLDVGLLSCLLVLPLALICGPIRGIPLFWRLIDCSFGLLGAVPLLCCRRISLQMSRLH